MSELQRLQPDTGKHPASGLPPLPPLGARSRTRAQVRRLRWAAVAAGTVWLLALLASTGLRPDHAELSPVYAFGLPAVMYGAGILLLSLCLSRGRSGAGPRPRWVRLALVLLPALFALSTLWIEVGAHSLIPATPQLAARAHLACAAMTLTLGALPFALALLALRYAFPVHASGRGALVGLCCGLAAAATIHMHCPVAMTSHILLSHGGPLVGLTLLGALLGRRLLQT